jgi:ABC-type lipoprotein release transport system permease subunit
MGRLLLIAVRNLRSNPQRTGLLTAAIAAVTMLLVLLAAMSHGMYDTMLRAATTMATGHVNVGGFYKVTSGTAAPIVIRADALKKLVEEHTPEATLVVDRMRGWGKVVSHKDSIQVGYSGIDIEEEKDFDEVIQILEGDLQGLREKNGAVIFQSQAESLDVGVGDSLTLSAPTFRGARNTADVRVVAIAKPMGMLSSFNIFVHKQLVRELYHLDDHATGAIQLYLEDEGEVDQVAERLRAALAEAGYDVMDPLSQPFFMKIPIVTREDWTGQKLDVTTWKDEMAFMMWTLTALDALTGIIVAILLTLIVMGVMNSLWMAIRERTREIGTLRAIGMQRARVLCMFVIEAAVLSLAATLIGAILGVGVTFLINALEISLPDGVRIFLMRDTLHLVIDGPTVIRAIVTISSITTLFAFIPAWRAARLPPITAIHDIG